MNSCMAITAEFPRRVLHVVGGLHTGGAETWLAEVVPVTAKGGWQPDFCLLDDEEGALAPAFRRAGFRIQHCSMRPRWSFATRLRNLMRAGNYGIVHSHVLLFSGFVAAIAKSAGIPVRIAHAHNSHDGRKMHWLRRGYRTAMRGHIRWFGTHALACSSDAAEFLGCKAEWLPYGVNLKRFSGSRVLLRRTDFGIPQDALVIGHVGRLTEQKNQGFLIRAFAEASSRDEKVHLVIAGEGLLREDLQRLAYSSGYADKVHFLGRRDDVAKLMRGLFDAFLMPSFHEGLPVALLEAQAAGLPCLVSDRIGMEVLALPEMVERLPLEAGSAVWAKAMRRIVRRGRMTERDAVGRVRAAAFDSLSSGERLLKFYDRAMDEATRQETQRTLTPLTPFSS